ncbi:hypothetical protein [Burkholderia ambifaria]|jgi:stage V sporulation protein SpoVS|uniref:hypothetical protein n=2 Tax=Burkholderia ambifaria TaxID=152480 RepID=UPI00158C76EA|nr:hypothetical protein [Burkholderia ambifaria]
MKFDLDSTYAFVHGIADELRLSDTHDIDAIVLQTANDIGLPDANEACDLDAIVRQTENEMGLDDAVPSRPTTSGITATLLRAIQALGPKGIEDAGGRRGLARQHGVNPGTLSTLISETGSLTPRGDALISQAAHPPTTRITASLLQKIQALGPQGIQDAGGRLALARQYGVCYNELSKLILEDGSLAGRGEALIHESEHPPTACVTASLLREIQPLGPKGIEDAGGLPALARQYGVNYGTLSNHISKTGSLTPRGEALIHQDKHPPTTRVTASLLVEIQALGPKGIKDAGGLPALAREYGVSYGALRGCVRSNGELTALGKARLRQQQP